MTSSSDLDQTAADLGMGGHLAPEGDDAGYRRRMERRQQVQQQRVEERNKEKGLILTNRHVVEPGPVSSRAVLLNSEEIDLHPLYRDPVHDFGLYRYNPEDVEHMELEELELLE